MRDFVVIATFTYPFEYAVLKTLLQKEGIFYYGLDTLVNNEGNRIISEINTLSIGGIAPSETLYQKPITSIFVDRFINYIQSQ